MSHVRIYRSLLLLVIFGVWALKSSPWFLISLYLVAVAFEWPSEARVSLFPKPCVHLGKDLSPLFLKPGARAAPGLNIYIYFLHQWIRDLSVSKQLDFSHIGWKDSDLKDEWFRSFKKKKKLNCFHLKTTWELKRTFVTFQPKKRPGQNLTLRLTFCFIFLPKMYKNTNGFPLYSSTPQSKSWLYH